MTPGDRVATEEATGGLVRSGRRRIVAFLLLLIALVALAAAWRWTALQDILAPQAIDSWLASFDSPASRILFTVGGVALGSLAMVPLTLLAMLAGILVGGGAALLYTMAGAMIAATAGFGIGRLLGRDLLTGAVGERGRLLGRRLQRHGTATVVVLRIVPVAPFAVFNLVAGSSHLGWRPFLLGSLLGLLPGVGASTLFSSSLWQAINAPSPASIAAAAGVCALVVAGAILLRRRLRAD